MYKLDDIKRKISDNSSLKTKIFYQKSIARDVYINGMNMASMHKLSKEIYLDSKYNFLDINDHSSLELDVIHADIIAYQKDIKLQIKYLKEFIPYINNWLVLDNLVARLKIKEYKDLYFDYISLYLDKDEEFEIRFVAVMYLYYFLDDNYIDQVINNISRLKSDKYYAAMAIAWLIAEGFIKYSDKFKVILENKELDTFTHNKAISKIIDSYRVSDDMKEYVKRLRKVR